MEIVLRTGRWPWPKEGVRDKRTESRNLNSDAIQKLMAAFGNRLPQGRHPIRTASYASQLSHALQSITGFTEEECEEIVSGTTTHDIGKGVGSLAPIYRTHHLPYSRRLVRLGNREHQRRGEQLLAEMDLGSWDKYRTTMKLVARYHHYPERLVRRLPLQSELIRWAIRIASIVDSFDAGTSGEDERGYQVIGRQRRSPEQVASTLLWGAERGRYEPTATKLFVTDCLKLQLEELPKPAPYRPRKRSWFSGTLILN